LSITPFYLSQLTKQYFNDVPKTLINRQVILKIKALLTHTTLSVNEIAIKLHFDDPSYLCRYFKRETDCSLSGYRQQYQRQ
ncbi:helix-turn-helix transcriptional regulator, partial [Acinetobacter baumannii]|nr:helix-turn-helix transcriptional regulator [Acinetobacter baumannii]